jgi:hypothetical protein
LNIIKKTNRHLYYWQESTKLWTLETNDILINLLIKFYEEIVLNLKETIKNYGIGEQKYWEKKFVRYSKISFMKKLRTYVSKEIKNLNIELIDDQKHIISFRNGIYDLKENKFRERMREDYISTTLNYDYCPEINQTIIEDIRKKIYTISNCDESLFEFNLSWLGYCLTGETDLQSFLMMIGYTAANGKSTLGMMFHSSLPIYSTIMDSQTFDLKYEKAHKQLAEVTKLIRFAILEEMSTAKLNIKLFKTFTAGGKQTCEKMFGTKLNLDVRAKLYCTSNVDPVFISDEGFRRRGIMEILKNKFVYPSEMKRMKNKENVFEKDAKLSSNFDTNEYKLAFVQLLIPYAHKFYKEHLKVPKELRANFDELCDDNDVFKLFIDEFVIIDPKSSVARNVFVTKFNAEMNKNYSDNFITRQMKKYCTYNRNQRIGDARGVYNGIKLKEDIVACERVEKLNPKTFKFADSDEESYDDEVITCVDSNEEKVTNDSDADYKDNKEMFIDNKKNVDEQNTDERVSNDGEDNNFYNIAIKKIKIQFD